MLSSQRNSPQIAANKCDFIQTSLVHSDSLSSHPSESYFMGDRPAYRKTKNVSLARQNKDGANAARTARITLISILLEENKKEVMEILRRLKEDIHLKRLMLNIGQREFKNRFLLKPELKHLFLATFDKVSEQNVYHFMRKNKRSQLNYKHRLSLCCQYLRKYKTQFDEHFKPVQVVIPEPLSPEKYARYMEGKGLVSKVL